MNCLSRQPSASERTAVTELYNTQLALAKSDLKAAGTIIGDRPRPEGVGLPELAAWIMVGRTLMNLDEFITKE